MRRVRESIVIKSITGIVSLLLLFSVIVGVIGYRGYTSALLDQYSEDAFYTADSAAYLVNPSRLDAYMNSGGETAEYRAVWQSMSRLCNSTGSTFIYVIVPDLTDYAHITFVFSTVNEEMDYDLYPFGYLRQTTNEEYKVKYKRLFDGVSDRELVVRDKGYIETDKHITAMIPLKDPGGNTKAILCVQRQLDILSEARNTYLLKVLLAMIILAVLVVIGQGYYLTRFFLNPVKKITDEARRFAAENVTLSEKLSESITSKDEIGQLAGSIDRMETQISQYVSDLTTVTAENERISMELNLATRIQEDMLPTIYPPFPDRSEFDIFASMTPARKVGGDFYDYFLIDHDHLCVVMADVSGKGIPAALFMMASKIILTNYAKVGYSPAEILRETNEAICSHNTMEMFVTVWLGILEISTGRLTAANAGHEYPILKTGDGPYEIVRDKHGFVLGGMAGMKYKEYEIQMFPGSHLFLYTDGVPEASNAEEEMFGMERTLAALNRISAGSPMQVLEAVKTDVDAFVQGAEQFDDLTMLCLEYK